MKMKSIAIVYQGKKKDKLNILFHVLKSNFLWNYYFIY